MGFSERVRSAFRRGDSDVVVEMSEAEIARARAADDAAGEVEARYSLARVAIRDGELKLGEARAREALEVALRSGDRSLEERPRHVLAAVARMSGDLVRARELYLESIAVNQALGRPEAVNGEFHNLAFVELGLGHLDEARRLFAEGRERVLRNGWKAFVPYVCLASAALAEAEGDHARAALMAGVTDVAFLEIGQVPDPDDAEDLASVRASALAVLGPEAFAMQYARGQLMDPRDA